MKTGSLYLVVSSGNSQDVAGDGPADMPHHIVELVEQFGRPRVPCRVVTRPDENASILQHVEKEKTGAHHCQTELFRQEVVEL